jgi:hypothetical protein
MMGGYNRTVWFSTRAITNIIAIRNLIDKYRVTYDSDDLMFVVHRESESKQNMEFKMHKSGLHYYDPRKKHHLTFVNTVSENKTGFTKRQIKCAEIALQDLELPVHEGLQVGNSEQSNQILPHDDSRH